ncbi:MAG: FecR domain-containing protein [Cyclobacteriaceae bacterium]
MKSHKQLIIKKITQEISPDEELILEEWMKSNPQNLNEFNELLSTWNTSQRLDKTVIVNSEDAWNRFKNSLNQSSSRQSVNIKKWVALPVAASFLLAILLSYFLSFDDQTTIQSPLNTIQSVVLPDSSTIVLNAGSSITYTSKDWLDQRLIQLTGEAVFDVKKSEVPFVVTTEQSVTRVIGTKFNIRSRGFGDKISCLEGIVDVADMNETNKPLRLVKGQGAIAEENGESFHQTEIDLTRTTGWIDGNIFLSNVTIAEALDEIEKQFSADIQYEGAQNQSEYNFHIDRNSPIEKSLTIICKTTQLSFSKIDGKRFRIYD